MVESGISTNSQDVDLNSRKTFEIPSMTHIYSEFLPKSIAERVSKNKSEILKPNDTKTKQEDENIEREVTNLCKTFKKERKLG